MTGTERTKAKAFQIRKKQKQINPELKRVNVDTTVETKAFRFPTDARLYQHMRERPVKAARAEGLTIKQSLHAQNAVPWSNQASDI